MEAALKAVGTAEGRLEVLINNARGGTTEVTGPEALRVFDTTVAGIVRVTQAALPLLRASANPVVVNLSSGLGSFWAVTNPGRPESRYPLASRARPRPRCRC